MPRSILDIDVNDGSFKEFLALFQQYQDSLAKVPKAWRSVTEAAAAAETAATDAIDASTGAAEASAEAAKEAEGAAKSAETAAEAAEEAAATTTDATKKGTDAAQVAAVTAREMAALFGAQTTLLGTALSHISEAISRQADLTKEVKKTEVETKKVASSFDGLGKRLDKAKTRAKEITKEFLQWSTVTGFVGAGAGILGVLGIDHLAMAASSISRGARGLGVDPAAQQAFSVNYQRYVDPHSMLSNVAGMQGDMSKWGSLMAAGIGTGEIQGDDPEVLSQRIIQRAKELWDQAGPNNHTAQFMQAHGLDQLLPGGLQDWRRIGGASQADLDQSAQDERKDKIAFALDPKALKQWTDFENQMHRAGTTMEDVLIGKLAPLAGPLTDLSKSITAAISTLLADPDLAHWIKELGDGVEHFAQYLVSPAFQADLQTAEDDFHKFTTAMGELVGWIEQRLINLGIISDPNAPPPPLSHSPRGDGPWNDPQNPDYSPGLYRSPRGNGPKDDPQSLDYQPFRNNSQQSDGKSSSWFSRRLYPNGFPGAHSPNDPPHETWMQHLFGNLGYLPWNMPHSSAPTASPIQKQAYELESWRFWKSKGYSDERAAGEVGNEQGESGFDPNRVGDSGLARGIEQWHKDRRDAILQATGIDVWNASHADQLKAAWLERQGIDRQSTETEPFLRMATTTRQVVTGLVTGVERSRNQGSDIQTRLGFANEALRRFGGTPAAPSAPADTLADAINKLRRMPVAPAKVALTVHDQTGGNAVVAAAQVAH